MLMEVEHKGGDRKLSLSLCPVSLLLLLLLNIMM